MNELDFGGDIIAGDCRGWLVNRIRIACTRRPHGVVKLAHHLAERFDNLVPADYALLVLRRDARGINPGDYGFRVGNTQFSNNTRAMDPIDRYLNKRAFSLGPDWKPFIARGGNLKDQVILRVATEGSQEGFAALNLVHEPADVDLHTLADLTDRLRVAEAMREWPLKTLDDHLWRCLRQQQDHPEVNMVYGLTNGLAHIASLTRLLLKGKARKPPWRS